MIIRSRRKSVVFFVTLGATLVAIAVALNVGWIVLNWRQVVPLILGIIFFAAIIGGLVLNTIFLVREIRRNEQHDSFINAVTHELKTPITSLRLYLETLKSRELDETQRKEFYDVMLADSDRLLHTVEQVLSAGRTGQKGRSLTRVPVDLAEVVAETVEVARARYKLPAEALACALPANGGATVIGDRDELRAALTNLLDNAVKYSSETVQVHVEVECNAGKHVLVRVHDQGIGIPRPELKQIFKRFYRVPGRVMAHVKGTGLGLSIVRGVVEKHGGRVFAESAGERQGSTFTIQLPRAEA